MWRLLFCGCCVRVRILCGVDVCVHVCYVLSCLFVIVLFVIVLLCGEFVVVVWVRVCVCLCCFVRLVC